MKTAERLVQIAKKNHKTFKVGDLVKCLKDVSFVDGSQHRKGSTHKVTSENLAYFNQNARDYKLLNARKELQKKVQWGSHQYVRYVLKRCEELAKQGYGSVEIKIDCTTDLYEIDEGRNSCYSHAFVVKLLEQEGFELQKREDYYDAQSYILYWQIPPADFSQNSATCEEDNNQVLLLYKQEWQRTKLPQAPDSEKIGMCWE